MENSTRNPSRLLRILGDNIASMIGTERKFRDVKELAARPFGNPIGQHNIYRILRADGSAPGLDKLERLAAATGVNPALLLCEGMDARQLIARENMSPEVAELIREISLMESLGPFTADDIAQIRGLLRLIARSPRPRNDASGA